MNRDRGRWFALRRSGAGPWSLFQQGTDAPDSVNRWMGSVAMDVDGNLTLACNVSASSTVFPGLRYAGRLATGTVGTLLDSEYTLIAGAAANASNRYGDYMATSVAPAAARVR